MSNNLVVIGGAMGGGGGGGGSGSARTPVTAPDSLRSVSIVEFVDGICEGEIEGFATADPLESVFLNDTPIKTAGVLNFQGVSLDYRLGTQDQTYIQGSEMTVGEDASAAIEFNVGSDVTIATPVTRTISSIIADAVRVTIQLNALWKRNPTSGDVNGTSVKLRIEVKPSGGAFQTVTLGGRDTISGKASSPYERSYHIELSQFGAAPYDIKLTRLTGETVDGTVSDTIAWKSYTELMYAKLRYPNTAHARLTFDARHFQQVPRRGYLLKLQKVRVPGPAFYDPVLRTYTGTDWDGTFVTAWTRCPTWCFYDIITDPRYGLGKEVPEAYMDKWNLWSIAQRCDALIPDGFGGTEPRYSLDLFLQQDNDAKKVIQDIASNFDAMGFWHGGGIFTAQDAPKSVSALYTPANVISGRFNYAGSARQVRYTVALVQWNDPDDFYKVATEYVEDTDGIARYGYREKKIIAVGCTSRGQAHRAGKRILLTSRLETDTVSFAVGLSGLANKPGDIIRLSDPLKHNDLRLGGRVSSGATSTTIPLDAPVTLEAGQSYTVCIVTPDGDLATAPVTTSAGTVQILDVFPSLVAVPDQAAVWSLYSGSVPSIEFRILWIPENATDEDGGFYEISAVRYDPTKYTEAESNLQLEPIYQQPYANTNKVIPPTGVITSDGVYLGIEGIIRYVDISWSASDDSLLASHIVKWSLDNGEEIEITITGNSYRIESAKQGTYTIEVYAINLAGLVSTSVTVDHILGVLYAISAVSVTNLTVKGSGGNTFEGRNAEFDWDTDADTVLDFSDSFGANVGGQTPWFRDFEVKVYEGANLLRTEYITESAYVYTFEKSVEDGGAYRSINIDVAARDFYGNLSTNATLAVSNPAPTTFSSITITPGQGQVFVEYYPPTDPDYIYTRVFASQTAGFTPDATAGTGNMVAEGSDRVMSFPADAGTWYIRLQGVDEFGVTGAVYSSQISTTVSLSDITAEVDAILADAGRAGDVVVEADRFIIVQPAVDDNPPGAVFGVGLVDGVTKVGIKGELLVDGSINAYSIAAATITADKMLVNALSAIAADIGTVTAGVLKSVDDNFRIDLDAKQITIAGPNGTTADDYMVIENGAIISYEWTGAGHQLANSLRTIESGVAANGDVVTLSKYYGSQPKIIVTADDTPIYSAANSNQDQAIQIRAESITEVSPGNWQFNAVSRLILAANVSTDVVNTTTGPSTGNITTATYTSPANSESVNVSIDLTSVKGTGTAPNYYYRTVTWVVYYRVAGSADAWSSASAGAKAIGATLGAVTDTHEVLFPSAGSWEFYMVGTYTDAGGTFTSGSGGYEYDSATRSNTTPVTADTGMEIRTDDYNEAQALNFNLPAYTPPSGWSVYNVNYSFKYSFYLQAYETGSASARAQVRRGGVWQHQAIDSSDGVWDTEGDPSLAAEWTYNYSSSSYSVSANYDAYVQIGIGTSGTGRAQAQLKGISFSATINIRKPITNSTTINNTLKINSFAYSLSGSTVLGVGTLGWQAIL